MGQQVQASMTVSVPGPFSSSWMPVANDPRGHCVRVSQSGLITASQIGTCGVTAVVFFPAGASGIPSGVAAEPISVTVLPAPLLFTQSGRAIAVNSWTGVAEPFTSQTRILVFVTNIDPTSTPSEITVTLADSTNAKFTPVVEVVNHLPEAKEVFYIGFQLPNLASGDVSVSVTRNGLTTNAGKIAIR